jgi:hypothetical protein
MSLRRRELGTKPPPQKRNIPHQLDWLGKQMYQGISPMPWYEYNTTLPSKEHDTYLKVCF